MRLELNWLLPAVSAALLVAVPAMWYITAKPGETFEATVLDCPNGDDCLVYWRFKPDYRVQVRLVGIDAPEGGQTFAGEATAQLNSLVKGREVQLTCKQAYQDKPSNSSQERLYCDMSRVLKDGTQLNVAETMVKQGFAWAAPKYSGQRYVVYQKAAEEQAYGLFAVAESVSPHCFRHDENKPCSESQTFMP